MLVLVGEPILLAARRCRFLLQGLCLGQEDSYYGLQDRGVEAERDVYEGECPFLRDVSKGSWALERQARVPDDSVYPLPGL